MTSDTAVRNTSNIIVIAGWSIPASYMQPLVDDLQYHFGDQYSVSSLALSSGFSPPDRNKEQSKKPLTEQQLLNALSKKLPTNKPSCLIGWSFGGTLACKLAALSESNVKSVVTLASNPCFVAKEDWDTGISSEVFAQFLQLANTDLLALYKEFSLLCSLSSKRSGPLRRELFNTLTSHINDLDDNARQKQILQLMSTIDARKEALRPSCPSHHIWAETDRLVPASVANHFPAEGKTIVNGGHLFWRQDSAAVLEAAESVLKQ